MYHAVWLLMCIERRSKTGMHHSIRRSSHFWIALLSSLNPGGHSVQVPWEAGKVSGGNKRGAGRVRLAAEAGIVLFINYKNERVQTCPLVAIGMPCGA